jgi:hypothetical protein
MKDLSKYISSLLEDTDLGANNRVYYNEKIYVIDIYLRDLKYEIDFVQKIVKEWASSIMNTYFLNDSIKYLINVRIEHIS